MLYAQVDSEVVGGAAAAITAVSAAIALYFSWLKDRDRLLHDEKLVRLTLENAWLLAENKELRKHRPNSGLQ